MGFDLSNGAFGIYTTKEVEFTKKENNYGRTIPTHWIATQSIERAQLAKSHSF